MGLPGPRNLHKTQNPNTVTRPVHTTMLQPTPPPSIDEEDPTAETHQTHHLPSINAAVILRQLPSQGISFQLWPAAATLVALLDGHRRSPNPFIPLPRGRPRILELGSGTGLVGIAAATLFAADVTVTDLPATLPNLQFNVAANAATVAAHGGSVEAAALAWGDTRQMEAIGRGYDVVLGSDLVYHEHLFEPLMETLKFFLVGSEKMMIFLMAHCKRWKKESLFFKRANKFFHVEVVHTHVPTDGCRVGMLVYKFVGKGIIKASSCKNIFM